VSRHGRRATPYHAIKPTLPKLVPGSIAVVIGVDGLATALSRPFRALTTARVIALDVNEDKLALARTVGAQPTVETAGAVASVEADIAIVGTRSAA
jgi:propanol-preferring alcohol dehydrogenase